jgi:hypothetical protein
VILEDTADLIALADRRRTLQQLVAEAKKFTSRRTQLELTSSRLQTAVQTVGLFHDRGIGGVDVPPAGLSVARTLAETASAFGVDPQAALETVADIDRRVLVLVEKLESGLQETWGTYARAKARSDNDDLLDVLERIPDFRKTVLRVRALRSQVHAQVLTVPRTPEMLDEFAKALSAIAEEWDALGSDAVPPKVIEFLRKAVALGGAELDLVLTEPAIVKWLTDRKLMASFRVKLA